MTDSPVARNFGPRSMFYSAKDLLLEKPGLSLMSIVREQSARQHLINEAVRASELLISSIRTVKPFDEMGNVELTVPQIEEARTNALAKVTNLLEAIERTNVRVRKHANAELRETPADVAEKDTPAGEIIREELALLQSSSIWPPDQVAPEATPAPGKGPTPADFAQASRNLRAVATSSRRNLTRYSTTGLRP